MSTLAKTIRNASRKATTRAADDEDEDVKVKGKSVEDDKDEPTAEDEDTDESAADEEDEPTAEGEDTDDAEVEDEDDPATEDDDEGKPAARRGASRRRRSAAYGLTQAARTVELCAIAGASARTAHGFIGAKTPLAKVRAKLSARSGASQQPHLNATPAKRSTNAGWDDVVAKVNATAGVTPKH